MCHEYEIEQDDNCELEGEQTYFNLQLSVTSTTLLSIDPLLSTTTVTIDDNREKECYVSVWYENTNYTISEMTGVVELCVTASSPGIDEIFTLSVTTDTTAFPTDFLKQSTYNLHCVVNSTNPEITKCYDVSFDFDAITCEYFDCSALKTVVATITKDETSRVTLNRPMTSIIIELPPNKCPDCDTSSSPSSSSSNIIIAATIPAVVVVIAIPSMAVVIMLILYWKKTTKKLQILLEERARNVPISDHSLDKTIKTSILSSQLREQLKGKGMLFCKEELELSNTVGQGESGLYTRDIGPLE
ncbi:hypothetical protein GBAR_LOCUS840 [Geodia barretti]|uniref:Uncharacterized protein n=1 Tax=Geodia barretti TaxID=519541 RepID=A0AA35VZ86_GEOBA|nr:hypothetical protein GBAR_LOCUS840 [Geodia barretti]